MMDYIEVEEGKKMKRRVLGLISFCIGFGMILAILVPAFGWAFMAAISLLCVGYFMAREC